jgi:hypothetical protein
MADCSQHGTTESSAYNDRSNKRAKVDGAEVTSKIALITGITGQVKKIYVFVLNQLILTNVF